MRSLLSALGSFIWSIADHLRGPYRPNQYGNVILPLTILRRLDCIRSPTISAEGNVWFSGLENWCAGGSDLNRLVRQARTDFP
ncbi:type I restriction-modification system subunit M N-terminal domain-containing protein [Pseudonocardia sp. TRM90224]|uniref:type I restriction-modification system subunit M N-terminal domain-containing protein n=1 Tax=Pseudonocardia sp. TRM90224 TaxID=2812678 RepID=UPI001E5C6D46|nr:type I restriction-modification system subunit M N-terminal domain-containing protein [Pseudonocardia sp. TRM90224]